MFIGHFAVGFASKRFAPRTNVATLIAAAIFLDILWPIFVLLGWEARTCPSFPAGRGGLTAIVSCAPL